MKPLQEYQITIEPHHLQGNRLSITDCPGYRACKDAVELATGEYITETFTNPGWGDFHTVVHSKDDEKSYAYGAVIGDSDKLQSMMELNESHIGSRVRFVRDANLYGSFM